MTRCELVRAAYQRFNDGDFEGALEFCDPEVEFRDLIGNDGTARGRQAVRQRWEERFSRAQVKVAVADLVEAGASVIAAVCCQVYDRAGMPVGPYVLVADRLTFRDDRILRIESTVFKGVPDEVKDLMLERTP